MTDDGLERGLHRLIADRDPGGAPERLRRRVDLVPATAIPAAARLGRLPGIVGAAVATAALIAAILILPTLGVRNEAPRQGAQPAAPSAPVGPGDGLAEAGPPVLPAIAVLAVVVLGMLVTRRAGGRAGGLIGLAIAGGGAMYVAAGQLDPLGPSIAFGVEGGVTSEVSEAGHYVVAADPHEIFRVVFSVRNTAPVPITLEGLARPTGAPMAIPVWVGLGVTPGSDVTYRAAAPVSALSLAPGDHAFLVAFMESGPCSTRVDDGARSGHSQIPLVVDVLGWERTINFALPSPVWVPTTMNCSGAPEPRPTGPG